MLIDSLYSTWYTITSTTRPQVSPRGMVGGGIRSFECREACLQSDGESGLDAELVEVEVLLPELVDDRIPARGGEQFLQNTSKMLVLFFSHPYVRDYRLAGF